MPLSCQSGTDSILATAYDAAGWESLRALNAEEDRLRLRCCNSRVTLKTSKLGTRFFAHKQRSECTSAAETAEHLFVKACVAQAISGTDWSASTEVRGSAPDGSEWVADVMATRGSRRVAFEVQWSSQSQVETARRQARLSDSGIRGLWLCSKPTNIQVSKAVPSLLVEVDLKALTASVVVPLQAPSMGLKDHLARKDPLLWGQAIELGRFIRGCLSGAFVWAPGLNQQVPLELVAAEQACWKCKKPTSIVTRLDFRIDRLVPGAQPVSMDLEDFDSPAGMACLTDALRQVDLKQLGIGSLRSRFSRTRGSAYLSNGCVHCEALQGAFYEHEVWYAAEPVVTIDCLMAESIFAAKGRANTMHWVFDERFEVTTAT
jgi:competence protein CoiA